MSMTDKQRSINLRQKLGKMTEKQRERSRQLPRLVYSATGNSVLMGNKSALEAEATSA